MIFSRRRAKTKPIENKLEVKTISINEDYQVVKEVEHTSNQTSANEMKEKLQFDNKNFTENETPYIYKPKSSPNIQTIDNFSNLKDDYELNSFTYPDDFNEEVRF